MAEQRMIPGAGFVETEDDGEQKQIPGAGFLNEDEAVVTGTPNPRLFRSTVFGSRLIRSA